MCATEEPTIGKGGCCKHVCAMWLFIFKFGLLPSDAPPALSGIGGASLVVSFLVGLYCNVIIYTTTSSSATGS